MAVAVERELHPGQSLAAVGKLGWLAVGAAASLAAGAIHAAAIGTHSEHRQAMVVFTIVAAIQLGWGALALARPSRLLLALGGLANVALVAGWVAAKVHGLTFIDGLDVKEPLQAADGLAAVLAVVAVAAALMAVIGQASRLRHHDPRVDRTAPLWTVRGARGCGRRNDCSRSDAALRSRPWRLARRSARGPAPPHVTVRVRPSTNPTMTALTVIFA